MKNHKKEIKKIKKKGKGIDALKEGITGDDPVTIVVSGEPQDPDKQVRVCDQLGHYLHDEIEVPFGQIVVLVTNAEEKTAGNGKMISAAGEFLTSNCTVAEHMVGTPMIPLGTLKDGTQVSADPLVVGRKVITIGENLDGIFSGRDVSLNLSERAEAEDLLMSVFNIELS